MKCDEVKEDKTLCREKEIILLQGRKRERGPEARENNTDDAEEAAAKTKGRQKGEAVTSDDDGEMSEERLLLEIQCGLACRSLRRPVTHHRGHVGTGGLGGNVQAIVSCMRRRSCVFCCRGW